MRRVQKTCHPAFTAFFAVLLLSPLAMAGGNHFIIEPYTGVVINQGLSSESTLGLESGGLIGVGGKLRGFPPRFFLYVKGSRAMFGEEKLQIPSRGSTACVERNYTRLVGGLRTIIPLFGLPLRLNLELGSGVFFSQNKFSESGRLITEYDETLVVMELGVGLNWRLFSWLSIGLMYDYTFVVEEESGDLIATILGEENNGSELGWSHISATLGFHF